MPKRRIIDLYVGCGSKWGPGKVHVSAGPYKDTLCAEVLHGYYKTGHMDEVTCKRCLGKLRRMNGKLCVTCTMRKR